MLTLIAILSFQAFSPAVDRPGSSAYLVEQSIRCVYYQGLRDADLYGEEISALRGQTIELAMAVMQHHSSIDFAALDEFEQSALSATNLLGALWSEHPDFNAGLWYGQVEAQAEASLGDEWRDGGNEPWQGLQAHMERRIRLGRELGGANYRANRCDEVFDILNDYNPR